MYYTTIKGTTKKAQTLRERARHFDGYCLRDVYGSFSRAKENAEDEIITEMENLNGHNYHICGHNSCSFSCAFEDSDYYYYFTSVNNYKIPKAI